MRFALIAGLVALPGIAFAGDDGTQPLNPLDPVAVVTPISIVQGDGIKIGEATSFYPQVGVETGYVSNVFYESSNPVGAGLLRVIAEVGAGSLSPQRRTPATSGMPDDTGMTTEEVSDEVATDVANQGAFQYSANLYATYDQYLSDNSHVQDQGGLGLGAFLRGVVHPGQPLSLMMVETFDRVIRATNFESNIDTNRDINRLWLQLNYQPTGRSIGGSLRYTNTVDVFEQDAFQFSDRTLNSLAARVNWKFLPLTNAYAEVSEGLNTGIGSSSTKVTSYPLLATLGLNTALSVNTTLVARVGYTQGFYTSGPDYQSVVGGAYFEYRYSPLGRIKLLYSYDHEDSINANFYRDHTFQAWIDQRVQPVSLFVSPVLRLREYQGIAAPLMGPPTRDDVIFAAWAGLRYQYRDWLTASLQYRLTIDQTDYRYLAGGMTQPDPSYVRHEILLGVRAAY